MSNKLQEMTQDIQARISELAYLMWESAGRQQGMAMEYWLKAEKEVMSTFQAAASHMMPKQPKAETKPAVAAKVAKPADVAKPSLEAPKAAVQAKPAAEAPTPAAETKPAASSASPSPTRKPAARGKTKA
jgi:hypothetical protein